MINTGLFWLLLWTGLIGWLLAAMGVIPAMLWLQRHQHTSPQVRRHRLFLLAALPWLGPLTSLAVAVLPAWLTLGGYLVDHCEVHGLGHPHLCFVHLPALHVEGAQAGLLLLSSLALCFALLAYAVREGRLHRRMKTFLQLLSADACIVTLATRLPLAFTAGILKPRIVMSQTLHAALTLKERHAVVRHEIAHIRAGDPWQNLVFEGLLLLHFPWIARRLRPQWRRAMEEQADNYVVKQSGDALTLAEALLKTAKVQSALPVHTPASVLRVDGIDTPARITRLLNPVDYTPSRINWSVAAAVLIVGLLCISPMMHHGLETLLGYLVAEHHH